VVKRENILVVGAGREKDHVPLSKRNARNWQVDKSNIALNVMIFHVKT